jgi:hypothetical protein
METVLSPSTTVHETDIDEGDRKERFGSADLIVIVVGRRAGPA